MTRNTRLALNWSLVVLHIGQCVLILWGVLALCSTMVGKVEP